MGSLQQLRLLVPCLMAITLSILHPIHTSIVPSLSSAGLSLSLLHTLASNHKYFRTVKRKVDGLVGVSTDVPGAT